MCERIYSLNKKSLTKITEHGTRSSEKHVWLSLKSFTLFFFFKFSKLNSLYILSSIRLSKTSEKLT